MLRHVGPEHKGTREAVRGRCHAPQSPGVVAGARAQPHSEVGGGADGGGGDDGDGAAGVGGCLLYMIITSTYILDAYVN